LGREFLWYGADAKEQALILMWYNIATLDGYLGIAEAIRNPSELFKHRVFFSDLEGRLAKSPYVAGDRFTYADIVAYVYVDWAVRGTDIDPTEGCGALALWSNQISLRPSVSQAT
jgi:glutathione S-transferase